MSTLAIMARYPVVGEVKTRLAPAIGFAPACDLYRAFLCDLDARFAGGPRPLVWMFHPPDAAFAALIPSGARCLPQEGGNLGERMHACFRRLVSAVEDGVIMIGADVPHVRDDWLDEAEHALDDVDVVLGPSLDGGYYLIAMKVAHDVFSGIEMGTATVLEHTLAKAAAANLKVHLLPPTFDVDDVDDLARLRSLLHDEEWRRRLPASAALLGVAVSAR